MRFLILLPLLACATVPVSKYEELQACPSPMSNEQQLSGIVRCRALCSSYAREFEAFTRQCQCVCAPAPGERNQASPWRAER